MTLELGGRACRCGSRGCLEAYAGAEGIIQRMLELKPDGLDLEGLDQVSALAVIVNAARDHNPAAAQVLKDTAHYLGAGVANLINLVNPQLVVLGGWVWMQIGELVQDELNQAIEQYVLKQSFSKTVIGQCQLGQDAVSMGAATLALKVFLDHTGNKDRELA
jgi:predicted NBD/HSP70 family sugar kinase